jgi:RNA-binding motif X-linked protein 2
MNSIRQTQALNKAELDNCTPPSASWHRDYSDTAFIYIGGLDTQLSEGDVITIFSQYGEPVFLNLVRDKETGKSKGFAFLKYEDQRSCDLAVDNLGGATVQGRLLNVDHTRYKKKDDEDIKDNTRSFCAQNAKEGSISRGRHHIKNEETDREDSDRESRRKRKPLKEEKDMDITMKDEGDEDPMKAYFIQKKKEDTEIARKRHHHRQESRSPRRDRDRDSGRGKDRERDRKTNSRRSLKEEERSSRHRSRSRERKYRSPSPRRSSHSKSNKEYLTSRDSKRSERQREKQRSRTPLSGER